MTVRLTCGANSRHFPVAGRTVGYVARSLRDAFNIPRAATACVNGQLAGADFVLQDGDTVEFVMPHRRKGGLHDYWSERELIAFFGQDNFDAMRQAGLTLTPHPVVPAEQVMSWVRWIGDRGHDPSRAIPVAIDVEKETVTYRGTTYDLERTLALALKCIVDAKGEIRSTGDIKRAYPNEVFEDRLDLTINRKLLPHKSGVGALIESVSTKGFRTRVAGV